MKLSDFDYTLPKELIANYPLKERDSARLLVLNRQNKTIEHRTFRDVKEYLKPGDLLVLNDTKVLTCRLIGSRATGGKVEVLLLNRKSGLTFNALIKPGRLKLKERIIFDGTKFYGELTDRGQITFSAKDVEEVYSYGLMPLPPYIKRLPQELDNTYYQTVYAQKEGSVAAPTAGLHFTKDLILDIKSLGVNTAYISLHISYSTFKPVNTEDITKHRMEPEYFCIPDESMKLIEQARLKKERIFTVGTTSLRALETYAQGVKQGYTDLFIYPRYRFKIAECLLTNFHLPRTTLFILVCAFAGQKLIRKAYQEAMKRKYRFYSYGDAMLIL